MFASAPAPRLHLVHGPTPLVKRRALDELLGVDLWIKRDDIEAMRELRGYGVMSSDQRRFSVEVARCSGVVLDHAHTGKALFALAEAVRRGEIARGSRVLFIHEGGLPGLLAQGDSFAADL